MMMMMMMTDEDFDEDYDDPLFPLSEEAPENHNAGSPRSQVLGFQPQKEIFYQASLPYAAQLDRESVQDLARIKSGLSQAVARREIQPAALIWLTRISRFLRHYGFKFSLSDHLSLIRLVESLLWLPNCDPWWITKVSSVLINLLRRKELIPRSELTLDWRPYYDLYERIMFSPFEPVGLVLNPSSVGKNLRSLNRLVRAYFPPEATAQILIEIRPLMCPYDVTMGKAMAYAEMFLPSYDVQAIADQTYRLWFDEFMRFWDACHNSPPWESSLMALFARLAENNIGQINWEPYIPLIFTRIMHGFNLPVTYKSTSVGGKPQMSDMTTIVRWIVSTMGPQSSSQRHLRQMVLAIETYYNAANCGRHSAKLIDFLWKLAQAFVRRIHRERYAKVKWGMEVAEEHKLSDEAITDFVTCLKPIALANLYSRTGMVDQGVTIQILSTLRPEIMLPPILERMNSALETLTEPHKLTASLHAMSSVSRSLVYPGPTFPEGPTHVIPLMMACLPGIDPNDIRKSMVTIQFISIYCTLIPIVDCSQASQHYTDLSEAEREIACQTAQFEDFVAEFLQRCFALIESSTFHQTREEVSEHKNNMEDSMKDVGLASTFTSILFQCSEAIFDMALRKVQDFVHGRILETKVAGKMAASLCRALCKVRPEKALKMFIPPAIQSVEKILQQTLHIKNKDGRQLVMSMLKNVMTVLTSLSVLDHRSIPEGYDRPLKEFLPIRAWGKPGNIHDLQLKWHIPSGEEFETAQRLLNTFLGQELDYLTQFASSQSAWDKEALRARLEVIQAILQGCGYVLPFWHEEEAPVPLFESQVDCDPLPILTIHPHDMELTFRGRNARLAILEVIDLVQARLLSSVEDDTKSLLSIVSIYHSLVLYMGITKDMYDSRVKSYRAVKRVLDNKLVGCRRQLRVLILDRVFLQHQERMAERNNVPFTKSHQKVIENLFKLSTSHYSQVRRVAQDALSQCISNFNSGFQEVVPKALPTFALTYQVPDLAVDRARALWDNGSEPKPVGEFPSANEIALGQTNLTKWNETNIQSYHKLVNDLCERLESGQLHWRHYHMAVSTFSALCRYDIELPVRGVKILVNNLIHENLSVRKASHCLVASILKQQKRKHPKIEIHPVENPEIPPEFPGDRPDNEWLCYDPKRVPKSAAEWDEPRYVHKTHFGYYSWPKRMMIYAPSSAQPKLRRTRDELSEGEKPVFDFFSDASNVEQMVTFLSLEECKGRDKFDPRRFSLFKGLFRNFGDTFLPLFRPHLERLIAEDKESSSRCVAEILASIIRGAKHWPYDMTEAMWAWVVPLIRKALGKITVETVNDWGTCFATSSESRDPFRIHWMLEVLMEEPLRSQGSFIDASRLYAVQGSLAQQEWRAGELLHRLLAFLKPFLTHPYQNVRERIGSVLTSIFYEDLEYEKEDPDKPKRCPRVADFVNELVPQLEILCDEPDPAVVTFQRSRTVAPAAPLPPLGMESLNGMPPFLGPDGMAIPPEMITMSPKGIPLIRIPGPPGAPPMMIPLMGPNGEPIQLPPGGTPPMMGPDMSMMPHDGPPAPVPAQLPPPLASDTSSVELTDEKALEYEKRQVAIRLLQTTARFLYGSLIRAYNGAKPEIFKLLPVLCNNEANDFEPNLARDCKVTLATIGSMIVPFASVPHLLQGVTDVMALSSWKANCSALHLLEVSVFMNLPSLMSRAEWMDQVLDIATKAVDSDRVEIREKAGQFLSGLLHCDFISETRKQELLDSYKSKAKTKLSKKKKQSAQGTEDEVQKEEARKQKAILKRHIGVIGLSAFVSAYPYDVPDFVPDILMILSDRVHDPQPIPAVQQNSYGL
eukprot:TCALIF_00223-PA protein Name:"Similar to psme4 Proteasome activator complex subunit 4 (Xenopus laevis)" AED:0.06 eAED:0.06 QI:66/0.84/0.71/1/0.84/0.85/14/306/1826